MKDVIYSDKQGSGYICDNQDDIYNFIAKNPVIICGNILSPGSMTTLNGFFSRECLYIGIKDKNEMIFYLGSEENLLGGNHYYQSIFLISETRIFEFYAPNSGRDFNYINGEWK